MWKYTGWEAIQQSGKLAKVVAGRVAQAAIQPRDRKGRFMEKFGFSKIFDVALKRWTTGIVEETGTRSGGSARVRITDRNHPQWGQTVNVSHSNVEMLSKKASIVDALGDAPYALEREDWDKVSTRLSERGVSKETIDRIRNSKTATEAADALTTDEAFSKAHNDALKNKNEDALLEDEKLLGLVFSQYSATPETDLTHPEAKPVTNLTKDEADLPLGNHNAEVWRATDESGEQTSFYLKNKPKDEAVREAATSNLLRGGDVNQIEQHLATDSEDDSVVRGVISEVNPHLVDPPGEDDTAFWSRVHEDFTGMLIAGINPDSSDLKMDKNTHEPVWSVGSKGLKSGLSPDITEDEVRALASNPLFAGMESEDRKRGAAAFGRLTDAEIDSLVSSMELDQTEDANLKNALKARRDFATADSRTAEIPETVREDRVRARLSPEAVESGEVKPIPAARLVPAKARTTASSNLAAEIARDENSGLSLDGSGKLLVQDEEKATAFAQNYLKNKETSETDKYQDTPGLIRALALSRVLNDPRVSATTKRKIMAIAQSGEEYTNNPNKDLSFTARELREISRSLDGMEVLNPITDPKMRNKARNNDYTKLLIGGMGYEVPAGDPVPGFKSIPAQDVSVKAISSNNLKLQNLFGRLPDNLRFLNTSFDEKDESVSTKKSDFFSTRDLNSRMGVLGFRWAYTPKKNLERPFSEDSKDLRDYYGDNLIEWTEDSTVESVLREFGAEKNAEGKWTQSATDSPAQNQKQLSSEALYHVIKDALDRSDGSIKLDTSKFKKPDKPSNRELGDAIHRWLSQELGLEFGDTGFYPDILRALTEVKLITRDSKTLNSGSHQLDERWPLENVPTITRDGKDMSLRVKDGRAAIFHGDVEDREDGKYLKLDSSNLSVVPGERIGEFYNKDASLSREYQTTITSLLDNDTHQTIEALADDVRSGRSSNPEKDSAEAAGLIHNSLATADKPAKTGYVNQGKFPGKFLVKNKANSNEYALDDAEAFNADVAERIRKDLPFRARTDGKKIYVDEIQSFGTQAEALEAARAVESNWIWDSVRLTSMSTKGKSIDPEELAEGKSRPDIAKRETKLSFGRNRRAPTRDIIEHPAARPSRPSVTLTAF